MAGNKMGMVAQTFNLGNWESRERRRNRSGCVYEASLIYITSSRPARATYWLARERSYTREENLYW